jgi:S-disulfanyl-L-cysteine oxidoreductase SoxD
MGKMITVLMLRNEAKLGRLGRYSLVLFSLAFASALQAQMPTYHIGRTPSPAEIRAADNVVGPSGKELLPGEGTAREGALIYTQKCAFCHGAQGQGGGGFPRLVGGTIHPFATTYWSIIYSSMPRTLPSGALRNGTLTTDEAYALTAWILFKNGIIEEYTVMNAGNLARVRMPTRDPRLDIWAPPSSN